MLSEFGSMINSSDNELRKHCDTTTRLLFEKLLQQCGCHTIDVYADAPYVMLVDRDHWSVVHCRRKTNMCDKSQHFAQHALLEHVHTKQIVNAFNCHIPTSLATPKKKKDITLAMLVECTDRYVFSGVSQPTGSANGDSRPQAPPPHWVFGGDLNLGRGTLAQWTKDYIHPNTECFASTGHAISMDTKS